MSLKYSSNVKVACCFRVPTEVWLKLSQEIWELFPTEEKDLYYEPYRRSSTGDTVKARGSLYNHYTYIRGLLREAGLLDVDSNEIELQSPQGIYTRFLLSICLNFYHTFILSTCIVFRAKNHRI